MYDGDIAATLVTAEAIRAKTAELAVTIGEDYPESGNDLLLVGVLKGAVMFMTDLARALPVPVQLEFMAVSSYGSATSSSIRPWRGRTPASAAPTRSTSPPVRVVPARSRTSRRRGRG